MSHSERLSGRSTLDARPLVEQYFGLITSAVRPFRIQAFFRGYLMEDLVQEGAEVFLRKLSKFDPQKGSFEGFMKGSIQGKMKHLLRDNTGTVQIPRDVQANEVVVLWAIADLRQELRREPTREELVHRTKLKIQEVEEGQSLHHTVLMDSIDGFETLPYATSHQFDQSTLRLDMSDALSQLSQQDRDIVWKYHILGFTQSQIADELGVDQMTISRWLKKARNHMKNYLESKGYSE